ncbi:HNH endonuclease [Candidatus Cryosericum hinesii]|jgi:putative restriction endonuclease|nr:HNH endonuclease signature motif containing protein [Candidatus Cryosericum hinesii]
MAKNYMTYWRPKTVDAQEWEPLRHSAGGQLQRVEPGDTVWIVTVRPPGHLSLLGRIVVGMVTNYEEAKKVLNNEDLWQAPWHIIAQPGTERLLHEVDLTSIADRLRFVSEAAPRLHVVDGHVDGRQLETMRLLTPETVELLETYPDTPSYWWVNHRQTFVAELNGGYIWSPKKNANGATNETYDNLTRVRAGDVVFSYAQGVIKAVGVAIGDHREQEKPSEYGRAGDAWARNGWLVPIEWTPLETPIAPVAHMDEIAPLLPRRHSPLQQDGRGNQGCYLASISTELGELVLRLVQQERPTAAGAVFSLQSEAKADEEEANLWAQNMEETEKQQLIMARKGQGRFRLNVGAIETKCRLTGTSDGTFLIASHIKPWADSSNAERLDANNGFLFAPHVDKLFDGGWISFSDAGEILCANDAVREIMRTWGLRTDRNVGRFNAKQKEYLAYHRENLFARRRDGLPLR